MEKEGSAVTRFIYEVLEGVPASTLVLGGVLSLILIYALFYTLNKSSGEISKGKIARFQQFLQDLKWRIDRLKLRHPDIFSEEEALIAALRKESDAPMHHADWDKAYALERTLIEHFTEVDAQEIEYDYSRNLEQAQSMDSWS